MSKQTHPDIRRTLLLLTRDDEVLLAMKKRGFGEGLWNGVGGKIEAGETIEQAMVRETEEEIGVTPLNWTKVAELDFLQDADAPEPWHMYVHAYTCDAWNGEPRESEEMRPQWFKTDAIPYHQMWDDDKFWLQHALKGEKLRGHFVFDERDRLLEHTIAFVDGFPATEAAK